MTDEETTGARLRAWRKKQVVDGKERSQTSCAEEIKATQSAWAAWERDESFPEVDFADAVERMTDGYVRVVDWARARRAKRVADKARDESGTDVNASTEKAG
jgi:transcriptional regulator with XRE-family HTH domain